MKDLIKKQHDFVKEKTFTGYFNGSHDDGFYLFTDKVGLPCLVPKTIHTNLAVSQIKPGDVCMIESTAKGFDVWQLEDGEIEIWKGQTTFIAPDKKAEEKG